MFTIILSGTSAVAQLVKLLSTLSASIARCCFKFQLLHFPSCFLLVLLGNSQRWPKSLSSSHPCGRPRRTFGHLALAWPSPGQCGHFRGRISRWKIFVSLSWSFCLSIQQIFWGKRREGVWEGTMDLHPLATAGAAGSISTSLACSNQPTNVILSRSLTQPKPVQGQQTQRCKPCQFPTQTEEPRP